MWLNRKFVSAAFIALMIPLLVVIFVNALGQDPKHKDYQIDKYDEQLAKAKPAEKALLMQQKNDLDVQFNFKKHDYLRRLLFFSVLAGLFSFYRGYKASSESLGTAYSIGGLLTLFIGILAGVGKLKTPPLFLISLVAFAFVWHFAKKNCSRPPVEVAAPSFEAPKPGRGGRKG